jgi:hypothetical protein
LRKCIGKLKPNCAIVKSGRGLEKSKIKKKGEHDGSDKIWVENNG